MASSSSNNSQKHGGSKSMEMEEIVRYMSNLPSYLERGKPIQDRALTFGVLDWGRLEQWQYHHQKQGVDTSKKYSSSSRGQSSTASLKPHHVTLQSHLNISPEVISTKYGSVNHSSDKKSTNQSRTQRRGCIKNDLNPQNLLESKSSEDMGSFHTASSSSSSSSSKGKLKIQDELVIAIGNLQYSRNDVSKSSSFEKNSQNEADSKRNQSATCEIRTSEEKESGVSLKNSDFKTGTVPARKHRFSFSMSSKSADTKSATKTVESPEDSKIKVKVKMDLRNCKDVRVDHSCRNKMNDTSSSKKQALFQMAVKNGRPLFTFSVDNNNDILAATVRSLTAKDHTKSWVYTFFTIHEVKKKKGGWFHHGTKDRGHGYLPNVTAQMKVTNPSSCTTREFVLYTVDSGQTDHQMLDAQPENELAAIVVRFARKEDEEENQDYFNMTVILAGGHHGVPRKGEPSPLIERWRSGGRCDCGGWDVGCRLKTFTNKVQSDRRSNPPENFHLFFQEDVINERPFFSLSPLKEGIFSVEFDSSLPLQHAFSICISVIECRKSSHQTELKTYVAKQVIDDDDGDDDDYEAPVTYASLPPVSPVERV